MPNLKSWLKPKTRSKKTTAKPKDRKKMLGETGEPRKQKVTKRSAKEVAQGKAQYKVTGGGKKTTAKKTTAKKTTAKKKVEKGQTFAQAFAAARADHKKKTGKSSGGVFVWEGKRYNTNTKDDVKAADKRRAAAKKVAAKSGTGKKMTDREAIEKVYGGGKTTAVMGMKPAKISPAAKQKQAGRGKKYGGMSTGSGKPSIGFGKTPAQARANRLKNKG
jgi:hypothetical protein